MTNPSVITVTLDLPSRELSPNSRFHWTKVALAKKRYRHAAHLLANFAGMPRKPWKAATVKCQFYFPDTRSHDRDNLLASMKAAFDGLADAGLVKNDADFTYEPVEYEKDANNPRVEITITELGD